MFEKLVVDVASRFNLSRASVQVIARGLLSLMTDERAGGVGGFFDRFRRAGLDAASTLDLLSLIYGGDAERRVILVAPRGLSSTLSAAPRRANPAPSTRCATPWWC